jgi:hypothetical protein
VDAPARSMPRFHARDSFAIHDKNTFVMAGFVIEGEIAAGMLVRMPFNATVMMTAKIDHIEFVRRPDGDVVCLCIRCASPDEATLWEALKVKDRTIEIIKADTP